MTNKSNYKTSRKYKCPYCELRATRGNLIDHVENAHQELIPEGYTAARSVFDSINGKDHGICMICKKPVYKWNDKINRYYNLCDNPSCKAKVREIALNRHLKVYNKPTLLNDPEQQMKMLANRRISGIYTFTDGKKMTYTGKYERNALEFMDKVLNIPSTDIQTPGPTLEYEFEGKTHKWITDIFYMPANLIIEIKDGGSNPNTRSMQSYRDKQVAKEVMITNLGKFNYVRLTDNNFAQLLSIFADIKMGALEVDDAETAKKMRIHINESVIISNKDIYYNKDKFDSGEINLCFITGHSGSGKSTMGRDMQSDNIEHYELDDVMANYNFSDENLKEYGDLIYSYFKSPGKKFRYHSKDEFMNDKSYNDTDEYNGYEALNTKTFVDYAIKYANSHKNTKFVLDGIWVYLFIKPDKIKDYAVYIKGTSAVKSAYRAANRDTYTDKKIDHAKGVADIFLKRIDSKKYWTDEGRLNRFKNYFKRTKLNEEVGGLPPQRPAEAYIVPYGMNNAFDSFAYGDSEINGLMTIDSEGNLLPMIESDFYNKFSTGPRLYFRDDDEKLDDIHNLILSDNTNKYDKLIFAETLLGHKLLKPEDIIMESDKFVYYDKEREDNICKLLENGATINPTEITSDVVATDGVVSIHQNPNGYFATTPKDFFMASEYFNDLDSLEKSDVVKLMNDVYAQNIEKRKETL